MIKQQEQLKEIERYEQYFSAQDGKHYELTWRSQTVNYRTRGPKGFNLECLQLLPDSVAINERSADTPYTHRMSLNFFNEQHPREQLDLRSNCHGFTFANGEHSVANRQIPQLLADEFEQVHGDEALASGNFDVVCFKEPLAGEWIHSAKYRHGLYMHKVGLQPYAKHNHIQEIVAIPDYQDSIPYFFRRISELSERELAAVEEALKA